MTSRIIASIFALVSFAAALFIGVAANNSFNTIVLRAILTMGICYLVGRVIGALADRAVQEHIAQYKLEHPIPDRLDAVDGDAESPASAEAAGMA